MNCWMVWAATSGFKIAKGGISASFGDLYYHCLWFLQAWKRSESGIVRLVDVSVQHKPTSICPCRNTQSTISKREPETMWDLSTTCVCVCVKSIVPPSSRQNQFADEATQPRKGLERGTSVSLWQEYAWILEISRSSTFKCDCAMVHHPKLAKPL